MRRKLVVEQEEEHPVEQKVFAQAIVDIAKAANELCVSGLNQRAIVVLLRDSSGQSKRVVESVLESLQQLANDYVVMPKKRRIKQEEVDGD